MGLAVRNFLRQVISHPCVSLSWRGSFCLFLKLTFIYCEGIYSCVHVQVRKQLTEVYQTQPLCHGSSRLYLLGHLIGPQSIFDGKTKTSAALGPAWICVLGISILPPFSTRVPFKLLGVQMPTLM